ncbi:hypothetical protein P4662_14095 [Priestia megaterium]|nr:hypothetical protein [Priestia megaterium]
MKKALGQSTDLVVREFRISIEEKFTLGVAYIDRLVNKDKVEHYFGCYLSFLKLSLCSMPFS